MDLVTGIVLGIVQGLSEFLPISSSGHLILVRDLFGLETDYGLAVDAVLQLATILAVGLYFFRDLLALAKNFFAVILRKSIDAHSKTLLFAVLLGTLPALFLGILLESYMESIFRSSLLVAFTLIAGSLVMVFSERYAKQNKGLTPRKGLLIGFFQALALVPGMSRSGMTIAGGLFLGLSREAAVRFSFILSFPIILGSGLKKLLELEQQHILSSLGMPLLVAFALSFVTGLLSIHVLIKYLRRHTLNVFVYYRIFLALIVLGLLFF